MPLISKPSASAQAQNEKAKGVAKIYPLFACPPDIRNAPDASKAAGRFTGQNEIDKVNPYSIGVAQNGGHPPLIIDNREQTPLTFEHFPSRRGTLQSGDYSLARFENRFTVERKSIGDLIGSLMAA